MKGIVKADARLAAQKDAPVNIALFGPSGMGKTTLARTLPAESTLFADLEGGTLAIAGWAGDVFDVRALATELGAHPWEMCRALALYVGGPDPADADGPYSKPVYDQVVNLFGDSAGLAKYKNIFLDSITVASRWCFSWCQMQPEAFSDKTGKPDTRGAYGLLGREMVRWLTHLQHARKTVIMVGILDRFEDELKRVEYSPQIEGSKAGRELTGIFDSVATLEFVYDEKGKPVLDASGKKGRAIYCTQDNPMSFPAKDRSGCLLPMEAPDLGKLLTKIRAGKRLDAAIATTLPDTKTQDKAAA